MESGRWDEMSSEEVVEILSGTAETNVDNAWERLSEALKKAKNEEKDVTTARIISEEVLTALGGNDEADVVTAQIILSQEQQINV